VNDLIAVWPEVAFPEINNPHVAIRSLLRARASGLLGIDLRHEAGDNVLQMRTGSFFASYFAKVELESVSVDPDSARLTIFAVQSCLTIKAESLGFLYALFFTVL
jgi:hypothetical protein